MQGAGHLSSAALRDRSNAMPAHPSSSQGPHSKTVQKPITAGQAKARPAPVNAIAKHQRIMQALAKQKLKRLSAWFAAWRALAKEAKVELLGASSMLKWRKLLRIWKVWYGGLSMHFLQDHTNNAIVQSLLTAILAGFQTYLQGNGLQQLKSS